MTLSLSGRDVFIVSCSCSSALTERQNASGHSPHHHRTCTRVYAKVAHKEQSGMWAVGVLVSYR